VEMMKIRDYYHWEVRNALVSIGTPAIAPMTKLLQDTTFISSYYSSPQESAVYVLGQLGKPVVKSVLPLLDNKDVNIRSRAVRVIAAIGPEAKEAVSKLVGLIKDTNSTVRDNAIQALGNIGKEAKTAVPDLIKLAKGTDVYARAA